MAYPNTEQIEKWHNDPNNWKLGFLYFNKQDERILVDKRVRWAGITLNFANPKSYLTIVAFLCFFGFVIYMIEKNGR